MEKYPNGYYSRLYYMRAQAGDKSTTYTVTAPEEPPSQFPWTYVIVAVVIIVAAAYIYMQQQKQ